MNKKTKKTFWAKVTHLDEEDLKKQGQEVKTIEKEKKISKKVIEEKALEEKEAWLTESAEGKLSLDVYQKEGQIIIKSALAGVKPEDLEIIIDKDILTIKGERKQEEQITAKDYFHQECFWGRFSRTVILPTEVETEKVKANLKNGILTINLSVKREIEEAKKVKIK